jgi:glycerol-3-phosphate dehydrogenase
VTRDLIAVLRYLDGQTDDAALTRAIMRSAQALGAELALPAEFFAAELRDDGALVRHVYEGAQQEIEARVLVNAGGPWACEVARRVSPGVAVPAVELVQGTHIVVSGATRQGIYYVESPRDGRAIFVMPWHGNTLVGTTETRFRGDPDQAHPLTACVSSLARDPAAHGPSAPPTRAVDLRRQAHRLPGDGGAGADEDWRIVAVTRSARRYQNAEVTCARLTTPSPGRGRGSG